MPGGIGSNVSNVSRAYTATTLPYSSLAFGLPSIAPGHPLAERLWRSRNICVNALPIIENRPWGGEPARRDRRRAPALVTSAPPSNAPPDDVWIQQLAPFSFVVSLNTDSLESALRRCAAPFAGLVHDAEVLYAVSHDRRLSPTAREYLQMAGQVTDLVSSFEPNLGLVQGLCGVNARALQILRGSQPTEDDLHNMSLMLRGTNGYRRRHPSQIVHASDPTWRMPPPLVHPKAASRTKFNTLTRRLWYGHGPIRDKSHTSIVRKDQRGSGADRDAYRTGGESVSDNHDDPGPVRTFEMHYEQTGETELSAGAAGLAPRSDAADTVPKRVGSASAGASSPERLASAGVQQRVPSRQPVRHYTMVGSVPLLFVPAAHGGRAHWQRMPLELYRSDLPARGYEGQRFTSSEREFVELEGQVYPFYTTHAGGEFIYSNLDSRLPPLPLQRRGNRYALRPPKIVAVAEAVPAMMDDGFIRVDNKRYIIFNNVVVEVSKPQLIAEVQIRQYAVSIEEVLPAPNKQGLIDGGRLGTVVEGSYGYYHVKYSATNGKIELLSADGRKTNVQLHYDAELRRWTVDPDLRRVPLFRVEARDSLEIYREKLAYSPFLNKRPTLHKAMSDVLAELDALDLFRPNRLSPHDAGEAAVKTIFRLREDISRRLNALTHWNSLSVRAKQTVVSRTTYGQFIDDRWATLGAGSQAFCSEMLDATQAMLSGYIKPECMLQILFKEYPGSGRTHVALLFADDPELFNVFGEINVPRPGAMLNTLDYRVFADWLLEHRETVTIIDPWGPEKVVDFSDATHRGDVELMLRVNLREAKFEVGPDARYRVSAVVPTRDLKAAQRASDRGKDRPSMSCSLFGSCKR